MTTKRQIRNLFELFAERHPEFKPAGARSLYRLPIRHIAGRVMIEKTRLADDFWLSWMVTALFLPYFDIDFGLGAYQESLHRSDCRSQRSSPWSKPMTIAEMRGLSRAGVELPTWRWSDPMMTADAIAMIETHALPKLQRFGTLEGYTRLPYRSNWVHHEARENRMLAHIAAGDLETARTIWREREPLYRGQTYHPHSLLHRWQMQLAAVAEPLLAGDRVALARILHGWEAANVRGTPIEPYWEPTPFALEAGLG